jgi:diadenosine tetraphosphate (Ap4A) HIT family hydrolase
VRPPRSARRYKRGMECLACDLASGRAPLPGGAIYETEEWRVEHCVGPLGVGTLVVKPRRHVLRVSELTDVESRELGPLLRRSAAVIDDLLAPEQVYVCLWSYAGGAPGHIHYVVQPITREAIERHGAHGPRLQAAMFQTDAPPAVDLVEAFAAQARAAFETS